MESAMQRWTYETMQDALARNQFIYVTSIGNSRVYIIDAIPMWIKDPNIIFHTGYRIASTPNDIYNSLISQGIMEEEVDTVLKNSITKDNYNTIISLIWLFSIVFTVIFE